MKLDLTNEIDLDKFRSYGKKLIEQGAQVELKKTRKKTSIEQFGYFHVVCNLYGLHFGYTLEEAKVYLKRKFGVVYEKKGEKFLLSSALYDTKQMTDLIEGIRTFAGQNHCYIPDANEYLIEQFRIDKEIDDNKEFLGN